MRGMRRFFWLLVFLLVFAFQVLAVEITQVGKVVAPHPNIGEEFIILISDNFWNVPEIQEAVGQWQEDLFRHVQVGSRVFAVTPCFKDNYYGTGGDLEASEQIRNFLSQQYWEKGITGVVFIGDIAFLPLYSRDSTGFSGSSDIFFADLDFDFTPYIVWVESNMPQSEGGGTWYIYTDASSGFYYDGEPEIWVSRIIPPVREMLRMTEEGRWQEYNPNLEKRTEMLLKFFEKNHEYWQGNEYCDFAYFSYTNSNLAPWYEEFKPVFPEIWCERREYVDYCIPVSDFLNLPETKMVYFLAHGGTTGIGFCDDYGLDSPEIYYSSVPVNIVFAHSCYTFDFSSGVLSVGQSFLFGQSGVVAEIGLGVDGCLRKFDNCPYSSILPLGEIWKNIRSWNGIWDGIGYNLMGDPFVWVVKRIFLDEPYYFEYNPFDSSYFSCSAAIKPLTLKVEDGIINLNFQWPGSINPVDIYVGVDARNSMGYFFVWTPSGIICWDGNLSSLSPYKKEWVRGVHNKLFSGPLNDIPPGDYNGWVLVVPSGTDMSNFSFENSRHLLYHWHWQK